MKTLEHEAYLALREGAEVIEADGRGDKVLLLPDGNYLKLFRRKRLISSAAWSPYAQRFADNVVALAERGIPCPQVIAVYRIPSIERDAVHYHPLEGKTLRQLIRNGLTPESKQALRAAFNRFVKRLHDSGIYFRSLHLGNVVQTPQGELGLIDISDTRIHRKPLSRYWRARNLRRMEGIDGERDWIDRDTILAR
ncbi:lipopolysaccharide kinase InaA family protein [Rhodocyclaceae bacterium SMB388]